jgi:hypothetical protein
MADEQQTPAGSPPADTGGVKDVGGGTLRISPQSPADTGPTLEEQSQQQDQATETAEEKATREADEAAAAPKAGEEAPKPRRARPRPPSRWTSRGPCSRV